MGSGCSTVVECTPHNREVVGLIPALGASLFLFLSSVMGPQTGPLRKCSIAVFPLKMNAQLCCLGRNKLYENSLGPKKISGLYEAERKII